jgi:hypothetical protein
MITRIYLFTTYKMAGIQSMDGPINGGKKRTKSPVRKRTKSPVRKRTKSPVRKRTKSPKKTSRKKSPRRKSRSLKK